MGFTVIDGFSRPDWQTIYKFINQHVVKVDLPATWDFIVSKWLTELASDLGGNYRVWRTHVFYILSDLDFETTQILAVYAELAVQKIRSYLGKAAWAGFVGKQVLLLFSDLDDYFSYISFYYGEENQSLSSGLFIKNGYAHIALPIVDMSSARHVLLHELVHNLLCHLPIPIWLNEGLASLFERQSLGHQFHLDQELAYRHWSHWNAVNIQEFWAGKAFEVPGDSSELSYNLSEILVSKLSEKGVIFTDFIQAADLRDAGDGAAINFLGQDLGVLLQEFLGPGSWRPQMNVIAEYWKRRMNSKE